MKVAGTRASNVGSVRKDKRSKGASGSGFASELAAGGAPAAHGVVAAVDVLDGVLSVQEVGDNGGERRRARSHGENLLNRLDGIRIGLLEGRIPARQLDGLLRALRDARPAIADPRLNEVLDEIELRAAVELAKLDCYNIT